jgi:hypothetical protein
MQLLINRVVGKVLLNDSGLELRIQKSIITNPNEVEGILLKTAWHWGSDCNVINNPLGKLGCTSLNVVLLSMWGSMDGDQILSPFFVGGLLTGDSDGYK